MNKLVKNLFVVLGVALLAVACSPSASQLKKALSDDPSILADAIKAHPAEIMEAIQGAARDAQKAMAEKAQVDEDKAREEEYKNPKVADMPDGRAYRGPKDAPVVLIEYSDFQCPFCKRGYETVEAVLKKYEGKVRFMYKHLPLEFHPLAMPAAKRFEAIALQNPEMALKYHDEVFKNQEKLGSEKEKFLDAAAKKVGADLAKMKKDMEGPQVKARIDADMAEARKFGFQGTPGFLVAGISLKGAYPLPEFEKIIDKVLAEKK